MKNLSFLLIFCLSITGLSQNPTKSQVVVNEKGIKVTATYQLLEQKKRHDVYLVDFQLENTAHATLSYQLLKNERGDGTYVNPFNKW